MWRSIHANTLTATCRCGGAASKVLVSPNISVYATPNKGDEAKAVDAREARWQRDMPEYKSMRRQGLQPPRIDGASALARDCVDPLEVTTGFRFRDKVEMEKAKDTQQALAESKREGVFATEYGKAIRGET